MSNGLILEEQPKYKYTFCLKAGSHLDLGRKLSLEPGGIYHTDEDMIKLHGRNRWELVKEGQESMEDLRARIKLLEGRLEPAKTEEVRHDLDDLASKSVKELRTIAAEMSPPVDLTDCSGKTEMINAIRQAMDAA